MNDLIYIPYKTTECGHNEIRITLRSIEKYVKNIRNLYIIGEDYGFYSDKVKLINDDFDVSNIKYPVVPVKSIYKFLRDNFDELTDDISIINDNCCFIDTVDLDTFPNYWKYPLENCGPYTNKKYENMEIDTYFASKLLAEGRYMNYETVFPLTINKEQLLNSEINVNYVISQSRNGILFKSYIMNLFDAGNEERPDDKQWGLDSIIRIKEMYRLKSIPVIGMSPQVWSNGAFQFLVSEFPVRSNYENKKIML